MIDRQEEIKQNITKEDMSSRLTKLRNDFFDRTQQEFAELLGFSQGFISDTEKGKKVPGGEYFIALAKEGVDINFLLGTSEDVFMDWKEPDGPFKEMGKRLRKFRAHFDLTEEQVAEKLEVETIKIREMEVGMEAVTSSQTAVLAYHYTVSPKWFLFGTDAPWEKEEDHSVEILRRERRYLQSTVEELQEKIKSQKGLIQENRDLLQAQSETLEAQSQMLKNLRKPYS